MNKECIMLGIDPGFTVTGFALLKKANNKTNLIDAGYLKLPASESLPVRIKLFHDTIQQKITQHQVTNLALETPFLGKNTQSFLKLGYLRGVLYLLASQHELSLHEFSPREVKLAVTGFGGASKEQVSAMVKRLFPNILKLSNVTKQDVTDAVGIGLAGIWQPKRPRFA